MSERRSPTEEEIADLRGSITRVDPEDGIFGTADADKPHSGYLVHFGVERDDNGPDSEDIPVNTERKLAALAAALGHVGAVADLEGDHNARLGFSAGVVEAAVDRGDTVRRGDFVAAIVTFDQPV